MRLRICLQRTGKQGGSPEPRDYILKDIPGHGHGLDCLWCLPQKKQNQEGIVQDRGAPDKEDPLGYCPGHPPESVMEQSLVVIQDPHQLTEQDMGRKDDFACTLLFYKIDGTNYTLPLPLLINN